MVSASGRGWFGANPAVTRPLAADNFLRETGDRFQADASDHIKSDNRKIVAASELGPAERSMESGNVHPPQGNRE
jgi:hypothetical protein